MRTTNMFCWLAMGCSLPVVLIAAGCASIKGETVVEKRDYVINVRDETLEKLYELKPDSKAKVTGAEAYGVFSNMGTKILLLSSGNGFGVVTNNRTGNTTFMDMREFGVGIVMGVKDFRQVIVFYNKDALNKFVTEGWQFGGESDAAAQHDKEGASTTAAHNLHEGMDIYQFNESGLALSATISGTKYSRNDELNK